MSASTASDRVARGAALLDEHVERWWERVDPDELDMEEACGCVLGQVFASPGLLSDWKAYDDGCYELRLKRRGEAGIGHASDFGFDITLDESYGSGSEIGGAYDELADLWRGEIEARR